MAVDAEVVNKVARLARLSVDPSAMDSTVASINAVLGLVDQLREAELHAVQPLLNPLDACLRLRPDVVTSSDQSDALQAGAPHVNGGYYLVPRVVE